MLLFIGCILSGLLIIDNVLFGKYQKLRFLQPYMSKSKKVVGVYATLVGLLFLISPGGFMPVGTLWTRMPFVGDLLPSVSSILSGLILNSSILDYVNFSSTPEKSNELKMQFMNFVMKNQTIVAYATLLFGVLHFVEIISGGNVFF